MKRNDFLNAVIDDGIMEITTVYLRPDQRLKRDGGIKGFEACRGKSDEEIVGLMENAKAITTAMREDNDGRLWYFIMYERQIEWVINVLSGKAFLENESSMVSPTIRGLAKAANILGISIPQIAA